MMSRIHYTAKRDFAHDEESGVGILLVNLGTPDAPTPQAVRRYLAEFLWDPRIAEQSRWKWWLVLHGIILRVRPKRSARAYASVWLDEGSPLMVNSVRQANALGEHIAQRREDWPVNAVVALGMRYGNPSIASALRGLRERGVRKLLVLPLYPQYSATSTGSAFDAVVDELKSWRWVPDLRFLTHYHDDERYIRAVASSVRPWIEERSEWDRLLFSFHGLPQRYFSAGDPYHCECHKTARLIAEQLSLDRDRWALAFQSRLGREPWLKPYTDEVLTEWAAQGVKSVLVTCPGFSADCLETLEEVAGQYRELFESKGGLSLRYIPALNDRADHIDALHAIILDQTRDWREPAAAHRATDAERATSRKLALALGAST